MGRCLVELNCGLMHRCLRVRERCAGNELGFARGSCRLSSSRRKTLLYPNWLEPSRLLCRNIVREDQAENRQWD